MGIIASLLIGALAGWLAGQIVRGYGFGLVGNIVIGLVGSMIGYFLADKLGIATGNGWIGRTLVGAGGAAVLLLIVGLFKRKWN
jgi:uncharacterized membrane protein YeaQ/YmgE (transglycosylase-associated protein family)